MNEKDNRFYKCLDGSVAHEPLEACHIKPGYNYSHTLPWIPSSERLPEYEADVLVCFKDYFGDWRLVRAMYVDDHTLIESGDSDIDDEPSYRPEGWYERSDFGIKAMMFPDIEGELYWTFLPAPPGEPLGADNA